ncbi:MAG: SigmaW regulon antibacterial [bacterium ADurb.Bin363]|nr:MAG: SigmaW regulon antibacterial [bacterium ADurb.Bin363]
MSVNPKIMKTALIEAMAQDGIQVKAICQVTVRANIDKLIGGAGEETVLARVGEGIVTAIGSAESHKEVLENPEIISEAVQSKGLDAGTAFEILSIDIADVDVGKNIGAQLQLDRANADKQIAQALAEKRRSQAIARSQEMKALVEEAKSKLIEAQAEVPKALAQALAEGKFSVLDYYDMQNIIADTKMREAIAVYGQGRQASS